MSNTRNINPAGSSSDTKKNVATHAAAAVAAGGLGVAVASAKNREEEELPDDVDSEITPEPTVKPTSSGSKNGGHKGGKKDSKNDKDDKTDDDSKESAPNPGEQDPGNPDPPESEPGEPDPNEPEPGDPEPEPDDPEPEPGDPEPYPFDPEPEPPFDPEPPLDPEEVANTIILGDQIDPGDIDLADVISFEEIGTVYTVDGGEYTSASFHDNQGNRLLMVDVDGDNVFDVLSDTDGNFLEDAGGNLIASGNFTVDDAELNISAGATYLASNENDISDDIGSATIEDDMIS